MLDVVQTVTRLPTQRCAQSLRLTQASGIPGRRLRGTNASHEASCATVFDQWDQRYSAGFPFLAVSDHDSRFVTRA